MDRKRDLEDKIAALLKLFPAVAVIGARQCGKSTLARKLLPDWRYYDLENPNDYQLISSDPVAFFSINSGRVIIHEAQQYPELFRVLRGVIDADRNRKGRFLLTGSSSPEIGKGITESLAGRIATVEMWPFKQGELFQRPLSPLYDAIVSNRGMQALTDLSSTVTPEQSARVWLRGGFPEPAIHAAADHAYYKLWMDNYIRDYIARDIRSLFPRLNINNFRRFLLLLAQFSGHQLNMSEMARSLEVSVSTIKDYLDIIHQTFVWRNLPPYEKNSLKKIQKAAKGFFRDQGILHYLLRIADLDALLLHPVAGHSFESFVTEEIIRGLHCTMETGLEFFYYRTVDKSEVDLVVEGFFGLLPIEIKLNSALKQQDLRGLKNFIHDTGAPFGIVVNRAASIQQPAENIVQIPVHYL
ncbi:ATPase protein [Desulfonatronospira thiodismutans ASO3-1]|uniref:ATPase protein n=1 Tax=Desulfonatronospira thiodismutans ASO3-1 TaxID=555779 RepID=D6SV47_9BACT|nr:ATP-binding protein [Desulfonatronospira thiodismutans]EFI32803.1 ATPase protein [Desulfonatronospira thiodismutans ASO3-1]